MSCRRSSAECGQHRTTTCQLRSTTAAAPPRSSYAPSSLGCSGGSRSQLRPRRTPGCAWPEHEQRAITLATRAVEARNGDPRPAVLRSAGPDRIPRCRPSARDVGSAFGGNGVRPRMTQVAQLAAEEVKPLASPTTRAAGTAAGVLRPPPPSPLWFRQTLPEKHRSPRKLLRAVVARLLGRKP